MSSLSPILRLQQNLATSIYAKQSLWPDRSRLAIFDRTERLAVSRYKDRGGQYSAGNGGSAADAQHLATEFFSKLTLDGDPHAAEAFTVDRSILTVIGNDYGYEHIFWHQLAGKATKRDLFLRITTSGQSKKIIHALKTCPEMGIPSIVFFGSRWWFSERFSRLSHQALRPVPYKKCKFYWHNRCARHRSNSIFLNNFNYNFLMKEMI